MRANLPRPAHHLLTKHELAFDALKEFGYDDLEIPTWGLPLAKGLTINDFEIYAMHYCIRIEHFFYMLDAIYDFETFKTRQIRHEELLTAHRQAQINVHVKEEDNLPSLPLSPSLPKTRKSKTTFQRCSRLESRGGAPCSYWRK